MRYTRTIIVMASVWFAFFYSANASEAEWAPSGVSVVRKIAFEANGHRREVTITTPVVVRTDGIHMTPEMAGETKALLVEIQQYIADAVKMAKRGKELAERWEKIRAAGRPPSLDSSNAVPTQSPIPKTDNSGTAR